MDVSKTVPCHQFPMLDVDDAVKLVLTTVKPLPPTSVPLSLACGRIVASNITATDPFPAFNTSIMDGYAVHGPLKAGSYPLQERVHAGSSVDTTLMPDNVIYITTGSRVPPGANAVVKVEDTKSSSSELNTIVTIKVDVPENENIRFIGSDIRVGELVLAAGERIGPSEIGLLATIGISEVPCASKPVVGVMSTGDELVEPWENPTGSQIRDSNRPALIAAFRQDGYECIDLGIIRDTREILQQHMQAAAERCDIVITSGGVSMGDADFVKGILQDIGTVHFGRIRMKPGKPTTFASIPKQCGQGACYFFGLPGNPVSCLVCKTLVVDCALKRLQGMHSRASDCMHPQVAVKTTQEYKMDSIRPEYHRVTLVYDHDTHSLKAQSTGFQRSSRLMSMKSANGLLFVPQGVGKLPLNSTATVLVVDTLPAPPSSHSFFRGAASLDEFSAAMVKGEAIKEAEGSSVSAGNMVAAIVEGTAKKSFITPQEIYVGLLTISDRAHQGVYADESGPEMARLLTAMSEDESWPLTVRIVHTAIVPDERDAIAAKLCEWTDRQTSDEHTAPIHLILTSGGTGFGPRDITPEAVRPLFHREAPAVAQALINEGLKHTPLAVLSRPVVGTRNETLICTLPGSVKAVRENIQALKPLLPRIMNLISTGKCSVGNSHDH